MTQGTPGNRFSWLNAVVSAALPPDVLDEPAAAWDAAADAIGVDHDGLAVRVAEAFRLQVADLLAQPPMGDGGIPSSVARQFLTVPLHREAHKLHVATCDPGHPDLVQQLSFLSGRTVSVQVATPAAIQRALSMLSPEGLAAEWSDSGIDAQPTDDEAKPDHELILSSENSAVLDLLILQAIQLGASDIHAHSLGLEATVRYRVDGVLQQGPRLPVEVFAAVLGRAKAVGGMDPSVRTRPQDGRGAMRHEGTTYDLRFSAIPSSGSESLVVRILAQGDLLALGSYGADADSVSRLRSGFLDQTSGIFIVTGPTGSGKTTLLYSLLSELNDGRRHIHTVEDPVEIQLQGLAQVQVNRKAGLTFDGALRSLLRQDPDVILISETRDSETAKAVTDAAMTGHLVATTLHTIDAATALLRLRDLGVDVNELAQVLSGISAQRLLRRLCKACREPVTRAADPGEEWFLELTGDLPAFRSVGCAECGGSGYSGRFPVVEVLLADSKLLEAFLGGASHSELRRVAQAGGMRTMAEIVIDRTMSGDTDVTEIRRVMGSDVISPETLSPSRPDVTAAESASLSMPARASEQAARAEYADVLVVTSDHRTEVIVEEGVRRIGFTLRVEAELPAAAVWAEIHRPQIVVLDVQYEGEKLMQSLSRAHDIFLTLQAHPSVMVLVPADDAAAERTLLAHNMPDYLRSPVSPEHVGFLAERLLRRVEVMEHPSL